MLFMVVVEEEKAEGEEVSLVVPVPRKFRGFRLERSLPSCGGLVVVVVVVDDVVARIAL
jgi:hypothetical protein